MTNDKKIHNLFLNWLICSLILVFIIIIVGGLTRLTDSGLSITNWELFTGILPPLNNSSWNFYFDQYKKIPQFKLINSDMTLSEFKVIFYWEYFHRILARTIGLFFFIPLIFFYFSSKIKVEYIKICNVIILLILLQGIIGWYMVKSGLTNDITVSHYRLSIHLCIAFIIISTIFWLILNFLNNCNKKFFTFKSKNKFTLSLVFLIFIQIIFGAFVSGLDAGRIYQTWPLMGNTLFPSDLTFRNLNNIIDLNNHSLVQFYHRNLAYLISIYVICLTIYIHLNGIKRLFTPIKIVILFLLLQLFLGILTLTSGLNIYLASAHQICSVLLVISAINLHYSQSK